MSCLTQLELFEKLGPALRNRGIAYRKKGICYARPALVGEEVVTRVDKDGAAETRNVAKTGDMVIHSVKGEEYLNAAESFAKNYEEIDSTSLDNVSSSKLAALQSLQEEWRPYQAKGEILGIHVSEAEMEEHFPQGIFWAPWGTQMRIEAGDVLAAKEDGGTLVEVYRIERAAFEESYMRASP
eukprot:TRINITY_DN15744_c0_g1_i1.p1 TRINITY_DN15744_c0_g1~~TRINITY_DN15744_c0_g1_i1.p1  ORF type:complete len:203 (+),score=46.03 TRINITY_DN15744_c0_g1_i1:61-609(+)